VTLPEKKQLLLAPVEAREPLVAASLAALEEGRRRTKRAVEGISQGVLDHRDDTFTNSVGTLLYHVALIEADWLYSEILVVDYPEDLSSLFPVDARDGEGDLLPVLGQTLGEHVARLDEIRARLLAAVKDFSLEEFRRPRILPAYDVTPDWVLQHLTQHEASHRGQMILARQRLERRT
jgi:uncharacterized damage-inducible protein DinB